MAMAFAAGYLKSSRREKGYCFLLQNRHVISVTSLVIAVCLSSHMLQCSAFSAPVKSVRIRPYGWHQYPLETTHLSASKSGHGERTSLQQKIHRSPIFLFPWTALLKIRTILPPNTNEKSNGKSSKRRRWEMPLTSKPFQGVENLDSTIKNCILALAVYFAIGTCVFPLLEPSWTFIDALYFSMTTLTTVAYGDVVVSGGTSLRAAVGKLFLLSFNIYAVCISVSALGIIAKLALAQEKKIIKQARQKARARLVRFFRDEEGEDDDEDEVSEGDEDKTEDASWADNLFLDKCDDDNDEPETMMGTLWQSLQRHAFNFVALVGLAAILGKVEKWSLVDVCYYWNCTATTMGYGDISPQTQIGRLLAVVFIPLSVITLGEVIASCVAHLNARAAAKAEKDFLRREITFDDLEFLDVNDDGKVCQLDFITFMLLAMQKVDRKTMKDLTSLFKALDADKTGYIEKEDLILLRQRKRLAKRLRREGRNRKRMYERGYPKIESEETQATEHVYDHLKGYRID